MKKLSVLFMMMVIMLTFAACGQVTQEELVESNVVESEVVEVENAPKTEEVVEMATQYPVTIVDHFDRQVVIESKPLKVISLAPSLTETVFALDAGEVLKGRTDYCTYPEQVNDVQAVGSLKDPSIETIAEIAPDVIFASTHFQTETMTKLEDLGFKVVILSAQDTFEGVYDVIEKAGIVLDKQEQAQNLVTDMKDKVNTVELAIKDLEPTPVYYVVGFGEYGDYTAGAGTFIDQMITMAGGANAASDTEGWSYSLEKLVEKDPYMLLCSKYYDTKAGIEMANGYKDLTAVKEGRLLEIDNDLLDRQGPRLADGLEALAKLLHPEAF